MGILNISNSIVNNSTHMIDKIINSKFSTALSGEGQIILVNYYNINDLLTTTESGSDTIDELLGSNSPIRWNHIKDFPVVTTLKQFLPEFETLDNNLIDMSIKGEATILPNTIQPSSLDFMEYIYDNGRNIVFQIEEFSLSTVRNKNYYKISLSMKYIDDGGKFRNKIKKQVVENMSTKLDYIGTNQKCIILDDKLEKINYINNILKQLTQEYIDTFYISKYLSILTNKYLKGEYFLYDRYLTHFISTNDILDTGDDFVILLNYDNRDNLLKQYNLTLFHNIELRTKKNIKKLQYRPIEFENDLSNPFNYYGIPAFTLDIFLDNESSKCKNQYIDYDFIDSIINFTQKPRHSIYEKIVIRYLNDIPLIDILDDKELDFIKNDIMTNSIHNIILIPVCIYILRNIIKEI